MEEVPLKELRAYAWDYFSLHAEQRLRTFHFFVILATVLSGAMVTALKGEEGRIVAFPMGFMLAILSFIFWKLDRRNRDLIKHAENALKAIEMEQGVPGGEERLSRLQLFLFEERNTRKKARFPSVSVFMGNMTYSDCFNVVFCVFGYGGLIFSVSLVMSYICF